ncbi:uncharacterized protein [Haliotis asinina]|uniref:uncharacterized protein n=1 Tax=Haliotis asinina TaxID=109174 RepID=UPI0035323167
MNCQMSLLFAVVCYILVAMVTARGRMVDPPNRSSLWRYGYQLPINRNDSDLTCGANLIPYLPDMDEWCGVCGDPIFTPRDHELHGKYVPRYVVTRTFKTRTMCVSIQVDTFLGGYFEFSVCPHNFLDEAVTQECFSDYQLSIVGHGRRYYPHQVGLHQVKLVIPQDLTCRHCVLQWRWVTDQYLLADCSGYLIPPRICYAPNEIRNCADIAITRPAGRREPRRRRVRPPMVLPEVDDDMLPLYLLSQGAPDLATLLMMDT